MNWIDRSPLLPHHHLRWALSLFGVIIPKEGLSFVEWEDKMWFCHLDRAVLIPRDTFVISILGPQIISDAFGLETINNLFAETAPFDQRWIGAAYQA